jgi:nucleoid DNA-binding protein
MQYLRKSAALGLILLLVTAGVVYAQRITNGSPDETPPVAKAVAGKTKLPVKTVQTVLDALGPEIAKAIQRGEIVELPKLGKIRLVRIAEHKDIERGTGRVLTVPGRNYVTLDAEREVDTAANGSGIVPNEVVPQFQYNIMPGQTPSLRTRSLKVRSQGSP